MTMISPWKEVADWKVGLKCHTGSSSPAVSTEVRASMGTALNSFLSASLGTISSLAISLTKSAMGCRMPWLPVCMGPIRF